MIEFLIEDNILTDFKYDEVQGEIVIPHGVKVISKWAFKGCPSLLSVVIPDTVEQIEDEAFLNCSSLWRVLIPDSVRSIGRYAFAGCRDLHFVSIPESVTEIKPCAFHCWHDCWGEYFPMSVSDFCICGKKGSEAERYAEKEGFSFQENKEEDGSVVIRGWGCYEKPNLTPDRNGNIVLISSDDEYECGITADGYPYESGDDSSSAYNYFKPIPWVDLYARIDELILLFRSSGFPEWADEYKKVREWVRQRPKSDSGQADMAVSVEQMREADRYTIAKGTSSRELMRRAAQGVFDAYGDWERKDVLVICGGGNNGGDGYALAEILHDHGIQVYVYKVSDKLSEDGAYYHRRCLEKGIYVEDWADYWNFDIYVDCLLGTGFHGVPREPVANVIREINSARKRFCREVISVDINSGMNGDTGEAELAVVSNLTVSIGSLKKGLLQEHARELIGKISNVDIGIEFPNEGSLQS